MSSVAISEVNPNQSTQFVLREAKKEDLSSVCEMIRALRTFHGRSPDDIQDANFEKYAFSDHSNTHILVAEMDGKKVGIAVFNVKAVGSDWQKEMQLEDLFVFEEFRGKGIGTELLKQVAQAGVAHNCGGIGWQVSDWNESGLNFYTTIGSEVRKELMVVRLVKEKMEKLIPEDASRQYKLRQACEADIAPICSFIRKMRPELELATFDLRGKTSAHIEIAELDGKIIGVALANFNFAAFQGDMEIVLESLYVDPQHSSSDVDRALFLKIVQLCKEKKYCRVAMNVLQDAFEFYKTFGSQHRENLLNVYLNRSNMKALAERK